MNDDLKYSIMGLSIVLLIGMFVFFAVVIAGPALASNPNLAYRMLAIAFISLFAAAVLYGRYKKYVMKELKMKYVYPHIKKEKFKLTRKEIKGLIYFALLMFMIYAIIIVIGLTFGIISYCFGADLFTLIVVVVVPLTIAYRMLRKKMKGSPFKESKEEQGARAARNADEMKKYYARKKK